MRYYYNIDWVLPSDQVVLGSKVKVNALPDASTHIVNGFWLLDSSSEITYLGGKVERLIHDLEWKFKAEPSKRTTKRVLKHSHLSLSPLNSRNKRN
jgi:hypothetical protein